MRHGLRSDVRYVVHQRVRPVMRTDQPPQKVFWFTVLGVWGLGVIGFTDAGLGRLDAAFSSIALFVLGAELWDVPRPLPAAVEAARFLAPALTFGALVALLARGGLRSLLRLRQRVLPAERLLLGDGPSNRKLLAGETGSGRLVHVDSGLEEALEVSAQSWRVSICEAPERTDRIRALGLHRSRRVYIATGSDARDLQVLEKLLAELADAPDSRCEEVQVDIDGMDFANKARAMVVAPVPRVELRSFLRLECSLLVDRHPPLDIPSRDWGTIVRVAVVGWCSTAEVLVQELARTCVYMDQRSLDVTVFLDESDVAAFERFREGLEGLLAADDAGSGLPRLGHVVCRPDRLSQTALRRGMGGSGRRDDGFARIYLLSTPAELDLLAGDALVQAMLAADHPLHAPARDGRDPALRIVEWREGRMNEEDLEGELTVRFAPLWEDVEAFRTLGHRLVELVKRYNDLGGPQTVGATGWDLYETLPQALHLFLKLRELGFDWRPLENAHFQALDALHQAVEEKLEALAVLEHQRFIVQRLVDGWSLVGSWAAVEAEDIARQSAKERFRVHPELRQPATERGHAYNVESARRLPDIVEAFPEQPGSSAGRASEAEGA